MPTISQALAIALQHHQAGRLEAAEEICRRILAAEPDEPDALHLLGMVAYQTGRLSLSAQCIARAIKQREDEPAFHNPLPELNRNRMENWYR